MRDFENALGQYILYRDILQLASKNYKIYLAIRDTVFAKVLNVKKNPIKIAQKMLSFGLKIKVYLFDSDYKFISQDCQRYLERTAKKRLSSIEQSSVL